MIGNPKHFCEQPRQIIHIDIDPASIAKRVKVDVPVVGNVREVLRELIRQIEAARSSTKGEALKAWWAQIEEWRSRDCLKYDRTSDVIKPQFVIETL